VLFIFISKLLLVYICRFSLNAKERLITRKKVIAILNSSSDVLGNEITNSAVNIEKLVLSLVLVFIGSRDTKANRRYAAYLSTLNFFSYQVINYFTELNRTVYNCR